MNRKLFMRLNVVLVPALILLFLLVSSIARDGLQRTARDAAVQTARLIMASAIAVREYTVEKVKPMIESKYSFSPLTVSSFAATQTLVKMRHQYPDFHYREVALNPTNPLDLAQDWEVDIVRHFRDNPTETEFVSENEAFAGGTIVVARPLSVRNPACLDCHSTPGRAPSEMTALYPSGGGFGWQLNEIVGAQIVTLPFVSGQATGPVLSSFALILGVGLLLVLVLVNLVVHLIVGRAGATPAFTR